MRPKTSILHLMQMRGVGLVKGTGKEKDLCKTILDAHPRGKSALAKAGVNDVMSTEA